MKAGARCARPALLLPAGEMPVVCSRALLRGVESKKGVAWWVRVLCVLLFQLMQCFHHVLYNFKFPKAGNFRISCLCQYIACPSRCPTRAHGAGRDCKSGQRQPSGECSFALRANDCCLAQLCRTARGLCSLPAVSRPVWLRTQKFRHALF